MNESECLATDWRTVGYEDGVAGYSGNRIGQYRKACSKHGVTPDLTQYQSGRDQGLLEFCKSAVGFRVGARGAGYNGVCPANLENDFLTGYQSGQQLHTLRSRVADATDDLHSMRQEYEHIDSDLVRLAAEIIDPAITQEHRAQLLLDTKRLAERKGELKAQIPQAERDLEAASRELDDYRASLTYRE